MIALIGVVLAFIVSAGIALARSIWKSQKRKYGV